MEFKNDGKGWLGLWDQKKEIGHIAYSLHEQVLTIEHTVVSEDRRGEGIAGKLIEEIIVFAKQKSYLIKPVCSYSVAYFAKRPELSNLLAD